jgi:hypothetical protein
MIKKARRKVVATRRKRPAAAKKPVLLPKPVEIKLPYGKLTLTHAVVKDFSCLFPVKKPKTITIENGVCTPFSQHLKRKVPPDRVVWYNKDQRDYTLAFVDWPFKEAKQEIAVPAGGYSKTFAVWVGQTDGDYKYNIIGGPPGGPDIVVDP